MIVIADTTPLRHLVAIGLADLLRQIYGTVTIPKAVWTELQAEATPSHVKSWLRAVPAWLSVIEVEPGIEPMPLWEELDPGERDAIRLAIQLHADLVLMDDRQGRAVAARLELAVTGTLGVLERADELGLLADFPDTITMLEESGFYLSPRLRQSVLDRHRLRSSPR